ncbi:uncharacterized protein LOC127254102 [Andrographis paniculata]|uniref:uncharacterized protein LOC127254102 n=1 Tax=Andrographis paniculata TaxID=175694 RepID=UPI0021E80318|nr:uncharacterized protein LOC127254102 [Andrographis paniculata]
MDVPEEAEAVVIGEEEEEEDDGPPPGFQCIINRQPEKVEPEDDEDGGGDEDEDEDEDEEEGPPPGFDSVVPNPNKPSIPPPDMGMSTQHDGDEEEEEEEEEDEDGPPPGWEFSNLVNTLPDPVPNEADVKMESNEELDEGPPPGWEAVVPHQMPQPSTPPLQPSSTVSSDIEIGSKQTNTRISNEASPMVSQSISLQGHSSPAEPPIQKLSSADLTSVTKDDDKIMVDKKPRSMPQPASPLQQPIPTHRLVASGPAKSGSEKAQLVCGTCRKLCIYPRGTKWVQCPGCQEVNFVLEAHDVGQIKCGGCNVLLMYPHGAPAVQCSSCRTVTEIGAHNRRPPLSIQIQQAQRRHRVMTRAR